MSYIQAAMAKRGTPALRAATIAVNSDALRQTTAAREGAAFLSGLHIGSLTSPRRVLFATPQPDTPTLPRRIGRRLVSIAVAVSVLFGVSGLSVAYGWQTADERYQGMTIETIREQVSRGWAPIEGWENRQTSDGSYDRVKGSMRSRGQNAKP